MNDDLRDVLVQHVFIHGLGGLGQDSSSWDKTISFLTKAEHVDYPDLWAMLSGKEITYANVYQSFVDYCNGISGKLNLCGLSLGGIVALNYAIEHPSRVQSMVLIGAQYKIPKGLLKLQNIIFRLMPDNSFSKTGMKKSDIIKLTKSMMDLNFSMQLKDVSCPTLIVCGEKDHANKKAAVELQKKISNAEIRWITDAGHELNIEEPEKLAVVLNEFLYGSG